MRAMVADLLNKSGSASAVAVSNVNIRAGDNTAYASIYSTGGWYGDLLAFSVNVNTGNVESTTPLWSARDVLEPAAGQSATTANSRRIATYKLSNGTGIPFRWSSLDASMQTQLATIASAPALNGNGAKVLNFLRGDRTAEADGYRIRPYILGDIVGAEPVVVRGAVGNYADDGYTVFRNNMDSRAAMIYQAANDGMLHAINAADGTEAWAYIPALVSAGLSELASPNYQHRYYTDGTPAAGDVYFDADWHTILVGGLRSGGKGYYALDVTSAAAVDENGAAGKVRWEFPNTATAAYAANMGFSFGKPLIIKTRAHGWVVIVTSGYNAGGDNLGHLYFLNPKTGAVLKELVTPAGSGTAANPVNLGQIAGFVTNGQQDLTAEAIYGGDNLGNVWRFDVSASSAASWSVSKLAQLTDAVGNPQPVTSAPELAIVKGKRVILIGSGRLLGETDMTSTSIQSVYAMVDNGTGATISPLRSKLMRKTVTVGAGGIRNINSDVVDWQNSSGWYFDLPAGERVANDPVVVYGTLVFTSNMPSAAACSSGSYLYAVDVNTGGQVAASNFAPGETKWTGKFSAQSLATRPVVIVLPNGQINSLVRSSDGGIVSSRLPLSWNRKVKKISWKEIIR